MTILLKAISIQLFKVIAGTLLIIMAFGLWWACMEYIAAPIIEWLNVGYGLGAGFLLIILFALFVMLIYGFISGVKNIYKNLKQKENNYGTISNRG